MHSWTTIIGMGGGTASTLKAAAINIPNVVRPATYEFDIVKGHTPAGQLIGPAALAPAPAPTWLI